MNMLFHSQTAKWAKTKQPNIQTANSQTGKHPIPLRLKKKLRKFYKNIQYSKSPIKLRKRIMLSEIFNKKI